MIDIDKVIQDKDGIIHINMGELAKQTGKPEVELGIAVIKLLNFKALLTGKTQHVSLSFPKSSEVII